MKNAKFWYDLAMEKMDEIKEAGIKAYKDSMDDPNQGWRNQVILHKDGDVEVVFMGGNSELMSTFNGNSIVVISFDCQNFEFYPEQCDSFETIGLTKEEQKDFIQYLIDNEEIEIEEDDTPDDIESKAVRKAYIMYSWNSEVNNRIKNEFMEMDFENWGNEAVDNKFDNFTNEMEWQINNTYQENEEIGE